MKLPGPLEIFCNVQPGDKFFIELLPEGSRMKEELDCFFHPETSGTSNPEMQKAQPDPNNYREPGPENERLKRENQNANN